MKKYLIEINACFFPTSKKKRLGSEASKSSSWKATLLDIHALSLLWPRLPATKLVQWSPRGQWLTVLSFLIGQREMQK